MLTDAAPVFVVNDLATSLFYYRDRLGFEIAYEYGEPPFYVLAFAAMKWRSISSAAIKRRGAPDGMRDFDVLDLDCNRLIYGMGSKA